MELVAAHSSLIALQDRGAQLREDLQNAARDIREQVRREMQAQADARGRADQATTIQSPAAPPADPSNPGVIVTPLPEGHQIIVGGTQVPPFRRGEDIPPEAVDMALGFFFTVAVIIIGLPLSRAFARRMDRKAVPQIPTEVSAQLGQLTQAVDAIALEVERISEGQRFTTRLLSEQRDAARHVLPAASDR